MTESPHYHWVTHHQNTSVSKSILRRGGKSTERNTALIIGFFWFPKFLDHVLCPLFLPELCTHKKSLLGYRWNVVKLMDPIKPARVGYLFVSFHRNVMWSSVWPSSSAAPGCPEVPTVPETVQIQGRPQLPHHGWTQHQGTPSDLVGPEASVKNLNT